MKSSTLRIAGLLLLAPALSWAQDKVELNTITRVEVKGGTIEITGTKKPTFTTFTMTDPPRLVIDISEAVFSSVPDEMQVGNGVVTAIKTASYGSDASAIARVLIGFSKDLETDIQTQDSKLVVKVVGAAPSEAVAANTPPATSTPTTATPTATNTPPATQNDAAAKQAAQKADADRLAQQQQAAKDADAKRQADADAKQQANADAKRQADDQRAAQARSDADRKAQDQAAKDAAVKADADKKAQDKAAKEATAQAERDRKADEAKAAAEAKKQKQEEARKASLDDKTRKQEEAQAAAEERKKKSDDARQAALEAKKHKQDEAQAAAEERKKKKDDARAAAAEKKKQAAEERAAAIEAKRKGRDEKKVASAETTSTPTTNTSGQAISAKRKTMTFVGFKQEASSSRVYVRTNEPVRYSVSKGGEKSIVLELENTTVGMHNNERVLDTSYFDTAVAMVTPERGPTRTVRIEIKLKESVPYEAKQEGNEVYVDFPRPSRH